MERSMQEGRMDGKLSVDLQKMMLNYKKEKKLAAHEDKSPLQNDKYQKIDRVRNILISKITLSGQNTTMSTSYLEEKDHKRKPSELSITKLGSRPRRVSKDQVNCSRVNSKYTPNTDKYKIYKENNCIPHQSDLNTPSMKDSHTTDHHTQRNTDCSTIRAEANAYKIKDWSHHTPNRIYGMIIESPPKEEEHQKDLETIYIEIKTPLRKQAIKQQSQERCESSSKDNSAVKRIHALNPSPKITPKTSTKKLKVNQQSIERSVRLPSSEKKRKYIDLMSQRPQITKKTLITCDYMPTNPF